MRPWVASALVVSALLVVSACAARNAHPEHASTPAKSQGAAQKSESESRWREMTWAEYYNAVMENARRRGAMVVWINPPPVREVQAPISAIPTGN